MNLDDINLFLNFVNATFLVLLEPITTQSCILTVVYKQLITVPCCECLYDEDSWPIKGSCHY